MLLLKTSALRVCVLLLIVIGASRAFGEEPTGHTLFDAYPLSDSVASLCMNMVLDGRSRPVALVYFLGPPGWHKRKWESISHGSLVGGTEASYELTSGELVLSLRVSADAQTARVQGKPFALADSNVFLVRNADRPLSEVVAFGRIDLLSITEQPLAVAAVRAHPPLAEALGSSK